MEENERRSGLYLIGILQQTLQNNIDYFACTCQDDFTQNFVELLGALGELEKIASQIHGFAFKYDYDVRIPANGYRTYCLLVERFVSNTLDLSRQIVEKRDSMFFRAGKFAKDVEVRVVACKELRKAGAMLLTLAAKSEGNNLFISDPAEFKSLLKDSTSFDKRPFLGRMLGYPLCESLQNCLSAVSIAMATFSEQYKNESSVVASFAASLFNSTKYGMDIDDRAERNATIIKNGGIDFLKSFWTLNEMPITKRISGWISPSLEVCENVTLPLVPLKLERRGEALDVPYPSSHLPTQPVKALLLSHVWRQGQDALAGTPPASAYEYPPTSTMFLHLHGGGFIAQSPESHEIYLRGWASELQMPLMSIDYSLAPEAPFPRALEEVFYAYAWLINNPYAVGWSGEKIVVGGDSCGGNLAIALALKCIHLEVRPPDALFSAYSPLNLRLSPAPSRLLCCMDPLLPFEFLLLCVHSYVGVDVKPNDSGSPVKVSSQNLEIRIDNGINEDPQPVGDSGQEKDTIQGITDAVYDTTAKLYQDHFVRPLEMFTGTNQAWQSSHWFSPENPNAQEIIDRIDDLAASPFISPLLADDQLLSRLPPTYLLGLHLDPSLDDMVSFAKRLGRLGRFVEFVVLDRLPHGFLNFVPFSTEAAEASKVCCDMLRDAFALVPPNPINPLEEVPL
ncbi:hormone-sensitive lipase [Galendromus occidentalis]|uniref:Hormone-sensitive lipase n=1 Tax=Galendromus occidentalis TaxID=34638 RepID=A0AAJ6VW49_9ACAR|nr:hormone-sensitive lipase [Galendromus occidentalis]